jgi:hypothetical protein
VYQAGSGACSGTFFLYFTTLSTALIGLSATFPDQLQFLQKARRQPGSGNIFLPFIKKSPTIYELFLYQVEIIVTYLMQIQIYLPI